MFRKRKLVKAVAIFFTLQILFDAVFPTLTYALTSGPTAPEATSFEPVDTTSMVNLATGDLAYNIPVLEVPGPAGGYPLSLSYHAGIQTNEDASWVGLGWTLNPGAIVRNVNGYADDHFHVNTTSRLFWEGGERRNYSIGVSIGFQGTPASVSAGLSISQDTYMGTGIGASFGIGARLSEGSPFSAGVTAGISPYGGSYASAGVGVGVAATENGAVGLSAGLSVSTNFESVSAGASAGVGYIAENRNYSLIGASISTGGGLKPALSVGGGSLNIKNSRAGKVSEKSNGFSIPIPVYYGVWLNLGYNYQRYWIDETENLLTNGAIYYPDFNTDKTWRDTRDYDTYSLVDPTLEGGIVDNPDANKVLGGSLPNYDDYFVHAQGLAGNIRPYLFKRHLLRRNDFDINSDNERTNNMLSHPLGYNNEKVEFRFINDFSNRYLYEPTGFINKLESEEQDNYRDPLAYNFDGETTTGENGKDGYIGNHLAGSRHIEWFTHRQIIDRDQEVIDKGFIETNALGFERGNWPDDQIGGFIVTNVSGVKYHFALPAASYDEYMHSQNITFEDGLTFNEFKKPERYAYTWYLTAVTGPDYIDRGPNGGPDGILNEYDWGYWVGFDYGLWSDNYQWRNPATGKHKDLDQNFENYSYGKKELYYLNKIYTKSHTAFFVKEIRADGKGVLGKSGSHFRFNLARHAACMNQCKAYCDDTPEVCNCDKYCNGFAGDFLDLPVSTLKLSKVILCRNSALNGIDGVESVGQSNYYISQVTHHFGDNVLDVYDERKIQLTKRSLRSIAFTHDYTLAPGTTNSYNPDDLFETQYGSFAPMLKGKLTLKTLKFNGKEGTSLIPPMSFEYDITESGTAGINGEIFIDKSNTFEEGDIIKFSNQNKTFYGVLIENKGDIQIDNISYPHFEFAYLNDFQRRTLDIANVSVYKTKNPPYNRHHYDIWGLYKPDVDMDLVERDENLGRMVSSVSAKTTDAWSLRQINTSLGSSISLNYQSDSYKRSPLYKAYHLKVIDLQPLPDGQIKVLLGPNAIDLSEIQYIDLVGVVGYPFEVLSILESFSAHPFKFEQQEVIKADNDFVIIENSELYNIVTLDKGGIYTGDVDILGGTISYNSNLHNLGGGIRVKSVQINSLSESHGTFYQYNNGVTSFEPYKINEHLDLSFPKNNYYSDDFHKELKDDLNKSYQKLLMGSFEDILVNSSEVPAPGVLYEEIKVSEMANGSSLSNYSVYNFETFNKGMIGIDLDEEDIYTVGAPSNVIDYFQNGHNYDKIRTRNVEINDYTTRIGDLKRITLYDNQNNKISETINHFLYDGIEEEYQSLGEESSQPLYDANKKIYESRLDKYLNQGVITETFTEARLVKQDYKYTLDIGMFEVDVPAYQFLAVLTKKEEYPSIQTGQTNINYKTGITTTTRNLAFDFYSGEVIKTLTKDSYGNYYVTEKHPAYKKYEAMGLAVNGGRNMLVQSAGNTTYKVRGSDYQPVGLMAASVQTWSDGVTVIDIKKNEPLIWRKHASYVWNGKEPLNPKDGTYPIEHFKIHSFNYSEPEVNEQWEKLSQITLFDLNSHALEATDINGNYAATRMDPLYERVLASAANASYGEIAYSGAENSSDHIMEGGVNNGEGIASTARSHTGKYSLQVAFNTEGFNVMLDEKADLTKKYKASVWVYLPGESETADQIDGVQLYYEANGREYMVHPEPGKNKSKNWYLLDLIIDPQGASEVTIGCRNKTSRSIYMDDFRVAPVNATMTSFVYDQYTAELTYILDQNNFYTHFEYDAMGRLVRTSREMLNYDFGEAKESFKADRVLNENIYNYGKSN